MTFQADIQSANTYLQQGNYKRALKAAVSASKKSPSSAPAQNIAGIAAGGMGDHATAIKHFQRAVKLKPDFADAQKNLAQTLILTGRAEPALVLLDRLCTTTPKDWKVWYLAAQAQAQLGQLRAALGATDHALALPGVPAMVYHLRSSINLGRGALEDGITDLRDALRLNPQDVTALINLSLPLARQTRTEEALEVVEQAVTLAPQNAAARFRLGTQLVEMGRMEDGVAQYRAALSSDPAHAGTLERLVEVLPRDQAAALEPAIRTALTQVARHTEDRAGLFYALSAALKAKGEPQEAAKALMQANWEMARLSPYDPAADKLFTERILERFPAPMVLDSPAPAHRPIFVLGLPRSGTTLVEAMLGAHPAIAPLGERGTFGFMLQEIVEGGLPFGAPQAEALRQEDARQLPALPEGTLAYVDKMPENYRFIGFLKAAYPDCRIVNLRRDPRDTALSMWRAHFSGTVLSYSYDLRWMAAKFNLYAAQMAHWRRLFGEQILDLRYADLVEDVDRASGRLADFCNVDWHPAMTRPDLAASQVLTLSATQIRQPVHGRSVGKWREHAALLAPFIADLDAALWHEDLD